MPYRVYLGLVALGCSAACLRDPVAGGGSSGGGGQGSDVSGANTSDGNTSGPGVPGTTGVPPQTGGSTSPGPDPSTSSTTTSDNGGSRDSSSGAWACSSTCGDGLVNCGEECDCGTEPCTPEGLGFETCMSQVDVLNPDHVFTGGELRCNMASCRFDLAACEWGCGDGILAENEACDPELDTPSCADLDRGTSVDPVPCTEECELDTTVCDPTPPKG